MEFENGRNHFKVDRSSFRIVLIFQLPRRCFGKWRFLIAQMDGERDW
jgi:hypothetical protein